MRYFDKCGFITPETGPLDEDEEVAFMSTIVKNANEYFNTDGIISPIMKDLGVEIMILRDDMKESEVLYTGPEDENGKKTLFTKPYEYAGNANYLVGSVLALSTVALSLF